MNIYGWKMMARCSVAWAAFTLGLGLLVMAMAPHVAVEFRDFLGWLWLCYAVSFPAFMVWRLWRVV